MRLGFEGKTERLHVSKRLLLLTHLAAGSAPRPPAMGDPDALPLPPPAAPVTEPPPPPPGGAARLAYDPSRDMMWGELHMVGLPQSCGAARALSNGCPPDQRTPSSRRPVLGPPCAGRCCSRCCGAPVGPPLRMPPPLPPAGDREPPHRPAGELQVGLAAPESGGAGRGLGWQG